MSVYVREHLACFLEGIPPPLETSFKETYVQRKKGCLVQLKYNSRGIGGTLYAPEIARGIPDASFIKEYEKMVNDFDHLVDFFRWKSHKCLQFKIRERVDGETHVRDEIIMILVGWLGFEKKEI